MFGLPSLCIIILEFIHLAAAVQCGQLCQARLAVEGHANGGVGVSVFHGNGGVDIQYSPYRHHSEELAISIAIFAVLRILRLLTAVQFEVVKVWEAGKDIFFLSCV